MRLATWWHLGLTPSSMVRIEWQKLFDEMGLSLSFLCLLHCLALPLVSFSLPVMANYYFFNPWIHAGLTAVLLPTGLLSFLWGYRRHRQFTVLLMGILGLILLTFASFSNSAITREQSLLIMIAGGVLLIAAYWRNTSLREACQCN